MNLIIRNFAFLKCKPTPDLKGSNVMIENVEVDCLLILLQLENSYIIYTAFLYIEIKSAVLVI